MATTTEGEANGTPAEGSRASRMEPSTTDQQPGNAAPPSHPRTLRSSSSSRTGKGNALHCSFVMLAEFDIDRGSMLAHVWPDRSTIAGHDDHTLAELMLPDGAHARSEDWTVFFLDAVAANGNRPPTSSTSAKPDLTYVINLVRTKHDSSVRRGALVKALAIGSRHPYLHIFKPALILALDDYYHSPSPGPLAQLYDAINAMDISFLPKLSRAEKLVLRGNERRDLFQDRFTASDAADAAATVLSSTNGEALAVSASNRGGTHSSVDLPSRQSPMPLSPAEMARRPSAASLRGVMMGNNKMGNAGTTSTTGNSLSTGPESPTGWPPSLAKPKDTHFWEVIMHYGRLDVPIRWPLDTWDDEVGEYSLSSLFQTFSSQPVIGPLHGQLHTNGQQTHPMVILFNAIVTYKRVIFLGHNLPAATVAGHVLAAAALASGCGAIIPGVKERVHPYANLISLDSLEKTPGYVAGVTNPRFEELRCWDVLCNIETGRVTVHKDIEAAPRLPLLQNQHGSTNSAMAGGIASVNGSFGMSNHNPSLSGDGTFDTSMTWSDGPGASISSRSRGGSTLGKSKTAAIVGEFGALAGASSAGGVDSRQDSADSIFMEELSAAIQGRCSETYVRSRILEYVSAFARHITRHEEHFYGLAQSDPHRFPHQPYLNGQIGSGTAFGDREGEARELMVHAHRVEGFRSSEGYKLWAENDALARLDTLFPGIDIWHQICRLRGRGKAMHTPEAHLIFSTFARNVGSSGQIVELLSFLPPHSGGLSPLALGLYHPSPSVRLSACEVLSRIASHRSAGLQAVQSLPLIHRLALARVQSERQEDFFRGRHEGERKESGDLTCSQATGGGGVGGGSAMVMMESRGNRGSSHSGGRGAPPPPPSGAPVPAGRASPQQDRSTQEGASSNLSYNGNTSVAASRRAGSSIPQPSSNPRTTLLTSSSNE